MASYKGYGAILGDMIASPYEFKNRIRSREFEFFNPECHFTDDTIMTIATMDAILHDIPYAISYKYWGNKYSGDYYGAMFKQWLKKESFEANDSWGNGAPMRVSPVAYAFDYPKTIDEATKSAKASHNNYYAITYTIDYTNVLNEVYLGKNKHTIHAHYLRSKGSPLYCSEELKPFAKFDASCQGTVPVAIRIFVNCKDYEDIIRTTVSLGGDVDTIASMACELQYAHTKQMDKVYIDYVENNLPEDMLAVLKKFNEVYAGE